MIRISVPFHGSVPTNRTLSSTGPLSVQLKRSYRLHASIKAYFRSLWASDCNLLEGPWSPSCSGNWRQEVHHLPPSKAISGSPTGECCFSAGHHWPSNVTLFYLLFGCLLLCVCFICAFLLYLLFYFILLSNMYHLLFLSLSFGYFHRYYYF